MPDVPTRDDVQGRFQSLLLTTGKGVRFFLRVVVFTFSTLFLLTVGVFVWIPAFFQVLTITSFSVLQTNLFGGNLASSKENLDFITDLPFSVWQHNVSIAFGETPKKSSLEVTAPKPIEAKFWRFFWAFVWAIFFWVVALQLLGLVDTFKAILNAISSLRARTSGTP